LPVWFMRHKKGWLGFFPVAKSSISLCETPDKKYEK
jgi:hypothetical protein